MKTIARGKGMRVAHANTIARLKGSKVQRHKGSTHKCNNKCKSNNKVQGAKAPTRCKGAKTTCMKATKSMKATTRCKGARTTCMKVAASAKAIVRHKVWRLFGAKAQRQHMQRQQQGARCEHNNKHKGSNKVQRHKANTCKSNSKVWGHNKVRKQYQGTKAKQDTMATKETK